MNGYNLFISIPEFIFDTPEPLEISSKVEEAILNIKLKGFTGDKHWIAAHSLGGVMAQD